MKNTRMRILTLLLLFVLGFIWGNSLMPGDRSSVESGMFTDLLRPILEPLLGAARFNEHLVRKLAHFSEFATLGLLLCLLVTEKRELSLFTLSYALFASVFVAVVDESLQLLTPERGPSLKDVLLDSAGAFAGILCATLLLLLIHCIAENS